MDNPSVFMDYACNIRKALCVFPAVASGGFPPEKATLFSVFQKFKPPKKRDVIKTKKTRAAK